MQSSMNDIDNEIMGYTEVIEIINILFKLKSLTLNMESLTAATRGVGHPSDFNLLPIKEFWIFSVSQNIHKFFKLFYRKEETRNY